MADAALNEQLNGLIDLLAAVGIDGVNKREIKKASVALKNQGSGAPIVFPPDIPEAKELNDDQIQAMILKLQQANAQAPNLLEAMQDYIDAKNGVTSSRGKKPKKKSGGPVPALAPPPKERHLYPQHHAPQHPIFEYDLEEEEQEEEDEEYEYVEEVVEEEGQGDHDDYDEDEEDDDFDEDADYPVVGPGVSDDISVVSDMTTPTVVSSLHVNEEEHYADMLPSMYIASGGKGPPMMIQPPKRKNLVSQVGRASAVGAAQHAAGGAASKRRQAYQQTMSRLHQNPYGSAIAGPAANPNVPTITEGEELNQSAHSNDFSFGGPGQDNWQPFAGQPPVDRDASARSKTSKTKKKVTKTTKKATAGTAGSAAEASPKPKKKKAVAAAAGTSIDKEGFLVGEGSPTGKPKKAKDPNGLSKSQHSSASGSVTKKKVKKKVVKKPAGDDEASPTKPKKAPRSKPAAH